MLPPFVIGCKAHDSDCHVGRGFNRISAGLLFSLSVVHVLLNLFLQMPYDTMALLLQGMRQMQEELKVLRQGQEKTSQRLSITIRRATSSRKRATSDG